MQDLVQKVVPTCGNLTCRTYAAEIAHNVSSLKRKSIVDRAAEVWHSCVLAAVKSRLLVMRQSVSDASGSRKRASASRTGSAAVRNANGVLSSAMQLNINVTNGKAKLRSQEDE